LAAGAASGRDGERILIFADEQDGERRRKSAPSGEAENAADPKPRKKRGSTPEVGHALRAAYQQTISEEIPPEFLDLLGKLG
jgi:hypothetical protein